MSALTVWTHSLYSWFECPIWDRFVCPYRPTAGCIIFNWELVGFYERGVIRMKKNGKDYRITRHGD